MIDTPLDEVTLSMSDGEAQMTNSRRDRLASALSTYVIPAGCEVTLSGEPYTLFNDIAFTLGDVQEESLGHLTLRLTIRGVSQRVQVPRHGVQRRSPDRSARRRQASAASATPDTLSEDEALEALEASGPGRRIHGAGNMISVTSDSNPGRAYTVLLNPAHQPVSCTCDDHTYRQRRCKHMRRAARFNEWEQGIKRLLDQGKPAPEVLQWWHTQVRQRGLDGAIDALIQRQRR